MLCAYYDSTCDSKDLFSEYINVDTDFALIKSKKVDEEYSTPYTLLDLDYDVYDVIDHLIKLDVSDFSEVKLDEDDSNQVICVSFHYSKWSMDYPFKDKRG